MRTLLLGNAPPRDLGHRAILEETARAVPHDAPMLTALPEVGTVDQVVLSGAFLERHALDQALAAASRAVAQGARLRVHNLWLEGKAAADAPPADIAVLDRAVMVEVRDHRTATQLVHWGVAAMPRILGYPERHAAHDDALVGGLPAGPILGLALRGGEAMEACWRPRLDDIAAALGPALEWPVLPLHTAPPGRGEDDFGGAQRLLAALRPGARMLLPDLADRRTWQDRMTPERLKALVARCALVVTNRDLPAAYAITAGVPVLALAIGFDRRVTTCLATLAREVPHGSRLLRLGAA